MKRGRRKERDSLPRGALARQGSRLSERPVILYMHWMGLESRGGRFAVYSFPSLFVHVFILLSRLLHFFSCAQKNETGSSAAKSAHGAIWQTEPRTMRLPDGIHRNEAWVALQNGCVLFESPGWTHQPPGVSCAALKGPSSVCIYLRKDTSVPVGIRWTPVFPAYPC